MLFNHTPNQPNTVPWNTILRGFVKHSSPELAVTGYLDMLHDPDTPPDRFTFPSLLKACAQTPALINERALHAQILKLGIDSDLYTQTTLSHNVLILWRFDLSENSIR